MKAQRAIFELYFDYVQHYGSSIRVRPLLKLTSELGLSKNACRAALCRLAKEGWLERGTAARQGSYYALTPVGRERITEAWPRVFAPPNQNWDGHWTVLTYSNPKALQHHRSRLRRELTWLGFGLLTSSTWVSPNPIVAMTLRHLSIRKLESHIHIFRARQFSSQAPAVLIQRCFALKNIEESYRRFINRWAPLQKDFSLQLSSSAPPSDNLCFATKMQLLYEYGEFLYIDPFLPVELLPRDWPAQQAWSLFRDFYLLLQEPALKFFEECYEGPRSLAEVQRLGKQRAIEHAFASSGAISP
jgi:phenylacetic acid degradation operon negative regulatory protein